MTKKPEDQSLPTEAAPEHLLSEPTAAISPGSPLMG